MRFGRQTIVKPLPRRSDFWSKLSTLEVIRCGGSCSLQFAVCSWPALWMGWVVRCRPWSAPRHWVCGVIRVAWTTEGIPSYRSNRSIDLRGIEPSQAGLTVAEPIAGTIAITGASSRTIAVNCSAKVFASPVVHGLRSSGERSAGRRCAVCVVRSCRGSGCCRSSRSDEL